MSFERLDLKKMFLSLNPKTHRFELYFDYAPVTVAIVRALPCAKWHPKEKFWSFPATAKCYLNIKAALKVTCAEAEQALSTRIINLNRWHPRTKPFKHQQEGVQFILERFGFEVFTK